MKKYLFIFISIIIILLITIIYITNGANKSCAKYHYYLTGMWIGDPEFLKKSNLTDLQFFISPKEKRGRCRIRNCYIIMVDINGKFILNQPIELEEISSSHNQRWCAYGANKKIKDDVFNIEFRITNEDIAEPNKDITEPNKDIAEPEIFNILSKKIILSLSMINGSLIIKNNNKIYGLLEKDLISSAAAISAYEKK